MDKSLALVCISINKSINYLFLKEVFNYDELQLFRSNDRGRKRVFKE